MRTLTLTSPLMSGPDIVKVQAALHVPTDGVFGPVTASAAKAWRYRTGFPNAVPALGPDAQRILLGQAPVPLTYKLRAAARARTAPKPTVRDQAVATMEGWAAQGLKEKPADSNVVPELAARARALGLADWYARMGWPWCAFTAFLAALEHGGQTATAGLRKGAFNALYCPEILHQATIGAHGMRVVTASQAQRGDLVLFDWEHNGIADHIGRLRAAPTAAGISTVEGNTSAGDNGSQSNGGGVYLRQRPLSVVRAFVRDS